MEFFLPRCVELRIKAKDHRGGLFLEKNYLLRVFVIHSGGQPAMSHGRHP